MAKRGELRVEVEVATREAEASVVELVEEIGRGPGQPRSWAVVPPFAGSQTSATSPKATKTATQMPMSPVRMRLEKRCRSPAAGRNASVKAKAMRSPEAKKRRDEILIAQVRENSRKVARAKAIARRRSQERERDRRQLAANIEGKLRAAEERRMRILNDIRERARRPDVPASPKSAPASPKYAPSSPGARSLDTDKSVPFLELEARISEAEERRAVEYERKLSQVREHLTRVRETCDRLRMTRRVQAWWRRTKHQRAVLETLISLSAVLDLAAASPSFEQVASHLGQPSVIGAARNFLDALRATAKRSRTSPTSSALAPSSPTTVSAARTFLAVLMIWYHPETVLGPDDGDNIEPTRAQLRKRLRIAAKNFFTVLRGLNATLISRDHTRAARKIVFARHAHLAYMRAFFAWKQVDALCIAEQLLETYVQIKENHLEVRAMLDEQGDNPDPGLLQHFEGTAGQLEQIRTRAKAVLRDKQLYRDWVARIRQRFPAPTSAASASAQQSQAPAAAAAAAAQTSGVPKVPEVPKGVAAAPSNEEMMHRLMVDPDYKLGEEEDASAMHNLAGNADAAAMPKDMLPSIVAEVCSRLAALTPNRADLIRQLEERLDTELLAQQVRENAFNQADLYSLVQFIGERLLALQAPIRQERTESWLMDLHVAAQERRKSWQDLAPRAFDFVLRELAAIETDMANFHLKVLRDNVSHDQGAAYLREHFIGRLRQGEYRKGPLAVGPHRTEAWFASALASVETSAAATTATSTPSSTDASEVVLEGMVSLLTRDDAPQPSDLPETLAEFDFDDICVLRARAEAFARVAVAEMALLGKEKTSADYSRTLQALLLDPPGAKLADVAENVAGLAPEADRDVVRTLLLQSANLERTVTRQLQAILRKLLKDPTHNALQLLKKIALDRHAEAFHDLLVNRAHCIHALHLATHKGLFDEILAKTTAAQAAE